jgi:O-antigen chain-terminating bifunctional methyltransferase/kinase
MLSVIEKLVKEIPEQYQQIFDHPQFDSLSARDCKLRLSLFNKIYDLLKNYYKRNIRVLDLGCAQGYFSLNLATKGAIITGIDNCQENINLCIELSKNNDSLTANFFKENIQDFIYSQDLDDFDLVIGLSVFHHISFDDGYHKAKDLVDFISSKIPHGIFEIALNTEPLYWADALDRTPSNLINNYDFINQIASMETHLSDVSRPIFFTSNSLILSESFITGFDKVLTSSHKFEQNAHDNSRKYYLSENLFIKFINFDSHANKNNNELEFDNEIRYLENRNLKTVKPKLYYKFKNKRNGIIVRDKIKGNLLYDVISNFDINKKKDIINQILNTLIILEKNGFYHNDLRIWNIIISDENKVSLIDFGAISESKTDCEWPKNPHLSFIILIIEILTEDFSYHTPSRKIILQNLDKIDLLKEQILSLFSTDSKILSYTVIKDILSDHQFNKVNKLDRNLGNLLSESLGLHVDKIIQIHEILYGILYHKSNLNISLDKLLYDIQNVFKNKNILIKNLEENKNILIKNLEENENKIENLEENEKKINYQLETLHNKLYNVKFTKHLYRAFKNIIGSKKYKTKR